jgi:hypothetical protein
LWSGFSGVVPAACQRLRFVGRDSPRSRSLLYVLWVERERATVEADVREAAVLDGAIYRAPRAPEHGGHPVHVRRIVLPGGRETEGGEAGSVLHDD